MDYKLLFDTAVFAGELLMKNGAETYRVEDTMYRILKKSNLKTVQVLVMMTGFVATLDDPSMDSLTVVRRINSRGTDLELIDKVNVISREFCSDQIPLEVAFTRMKTLWREPHESKRNLAAMAALTGGFAVMFGGSAADVAVAAATGFLTAAVLFYCRKIHLHMFLENMLCSVFLAIVVGLAVTFLPGEYSRDLIIISAIMPLVPGAAITNAVFDTLHGDYLSGLARAAEAFVIAAAVALGIGIGMSLI
ncbi:MAG: threonine/serine exporter family protein [Clostridiales bacterium]|uniref:Threonine/serine exporter family protein n=1 Tax=Candidatus Pullilachnospira stercoravium TaxID=2840913 RepID=A0A9D1T777_9FIRM|nr:threonine/serine exporter family protein [Clostridiales bacterium]HIV13976.1 threonine/serine exporter family protein [Candidatus Pullilachnospira stercoravium]